MKNKIFKTAMMAVVVLTLMAGSALADVIKPYIDGTLSFGGFLTAVCIDGTCNDFRTIYAMQLNPIGFEVIDGVVTPNSGASLGITFDSHAPYDMLVPTGDFVPLVAIFGRDPIIDFPLAEFWTPDEFGEIGKLQFRELDGTLKDALGFSYSSDDDPCSLDNMDACGLGFGVIDGFTFFIEKITDVVFDYVGNGSGESERFSLGMTGWVLHEDFAPTPFRYTFSADTTRGNPWSWTMNLDPYNPPTIPEPGTLVLLGSGLLGAAIIARKKMRK